jgi:uncharacterized protein (TIGR02466 family)
MAKKITPFVTSIWSDKLNLDKDTHARIVDFVYALKNDDDGVNISNLGGWQSKSVVEIHPHIEPMFTLMKKLTMGVLTDLNLLQDGYVPIVDNYWFNVNKKGDLNVAHDHPGSSLSGVVYLKKPKNSGDIVFERTDMQTWAFPGSIDPSKPGFADRCSAFTLRTEELDYVIFPSSLRHSVEPNMSNEDRISMAINFSLRKQ